MEETASTVEMGIRVRRLEKNWYTTYYFYNGMAAARLKACDRLSLLHAEGSSSTTVDRHPMSFATYCPGTRPFQTRRPNPHSNVPVPDPHRVLPPRPVPAHLRPKRGEERYEVAPPQARVGLIGFPCLLLRIIVPPPPAPPPSDIRKAGYFKLDAPRLEAEGRRGWGRDWRVAVRVDLAYDVGVYFVGERHEARAGEAAGWVREGAGEEVEWAAGDGGPVFVHGSGAGGADGC